ncbi:U-box domain-containing protein 62 [Mangifera indica]|uniref:U-box domain-containing protein 62 n=1 Tax=Mangifera indica TaxID=29780 RepID=UPI001CF940EA|nr:U-box domain-containing protein 62 [Mangifera indica]
MTSEEISINGLNSQLVFQDDALRFNCQQQQHRVGDPGPKTRELTGFIDDKMFSVDRDRFFRSQSAIYDPQPHDRRDTRGTRDWNGHATSPSTDQSDGEEDDIDDEDDEADDDLIEDGHNNKKNNNTSCSNNNNKNNSANCSVITGAVDKTKNEGFIKNGNGVQTVNNSMVTVAEVDGDVYYSQYLQGSNEGSSGSGQKECVVVDNGCGISGSGDSLRAILSDPVTGALMDDAMILPCGHSFGSAGIQQILRNKACYTCSQPVSEDSVAPNLSLRAAVQAFRREEELLYYRSSKRRRERFDQDKGNFGDSSVMEPPRGRGVQFPFAVTDRVIIKGNKRTPQRFVGREAVVTTQCLNGWYVVKTLDNAESVKLQYRSLAKVSDDISKPMSSKMAPNWL